MVYIRGDLIIALLLILFGISMLLKVFFNIDLPLFRVGIAIVLIWAGCSILQSAYYHHNSSVRWVWTQNPNEEDKDDE